jgi:hypothetical protein
MARGHFPQTLWTFRAVAIAQLQKRCGSADHRRGVVDRELHCVAATPIVTA